MSQTLAHTRRRRAIVERRPEASVLGAATVGVPFDALRIEARPERSRCDVEAENAGALPLRRRGRERRSDLARSDPFPYALRPSAALLVMNGLLLIDELELAVGALPLVLLAQRVAVSANEVRIGRERTHRGGHCGTARPRGQEVERWTERDGGR